MYLSQQKNFKHHVVENTPQIQMSYLILFIPLIVVKIRSNLQKIWKSGIKLKTNRLSWKYLDIRKNYFHVLDIYTLQVIGLIFQPYSN